MPSIYLRANARDHLRMPWGQEAYEASQGLLDTYRASPVATLPAYAMQHACIDAFVKKARVNKLGEKHSSTLWDIAHASVGAAYADVFTCDKRKAEAYARFAKSPAPARCVRSSSR